MQLLKPRNDVVNNVLNETNAAASSTDDGCWHCQYAAYSVQGGARDNHYYHIWVDCMACL